MKKFINLLLCSILLFSFIFNVDGTSNFKINNDFYILCSSFSKAYKKNNDVTRIMTYNVLSQGIGFDGMPVETRQNSLYILLKNILPDILCLQEADSNWTKALSSFENDLKLSQPTKYKISNLMTTILYNTETLTLLKNDFRAYSSGSDSRLRSYSWCIFENKKTHKRFIVVNTHLSMFEKDVYSPFNQATELMSFCKNIFKEYNYPVFIVGDFNTKERNKDTENSAVYEYLNLHFTNSFELAENTSHGSQGTTQSNANDYIFTLGKVNIKNYVLLSQPQLNIISDHYPVFADVS